LHVLNHEYENVPYAVHNLCCKQDPEVRLLFFFGTAL